MLVFRVGDNNFQLFLAVILVTGENLNLPNNIAILVSYKCPIVVE